MDVVTIGLNNKAFVMVLNHADNIRVVAPVTYDHAGEIFDWAAYIGVGGTIDVVDHGEKLYRPWAAALYPDLPIGRYRD